MPRYDKTFQIPGQSAEEIYQKIKPELQALLSKLSLEKLDLSQDDARLEFSLKSPQATLTLSCLDEELQLEGKLSLVASVFTGKINEGIERWLKDKFKTVVS